MSQKRLNIYHYNDYRLYLRDYFAEQKRVNPAFTNRSFAQKAGFGAHSFCIYLINGKRNLSSEGAAKLCSAMGLDKKESDFFMLLVRFCQCTTTEGRDQLFRQLNLLRRTSTFYKLKKEHYAYFDEWYIPAVREVAVHGDWHGDYDRLGSLLVPAITAVQARRAVAVLERIGLIRKNEDGSWSQVSEAVVADDLPPHLVKKARNAYLRLALDASENLGPDVRNISCATVALGKESYEKVSRLLDTLHEQVVALAAQDRTPQKVYQMNLQLFPLSGTIRKETPGGADA